MAQTKPQSKKFITGSAIVYVGDRFDKMTNIGACNSIKAEETKTTTEQESDNAGVIATLVTDHTITVSLEALELNLKNMAMMRGSNDKLEEYDGKTKVVRKYPVSRDTWIHGELIKAPFKNADGSDVSVVSVSYETNDVITELTEEQYEKVGSNGIKIIDTDIDPTTAVLYLKYDWTPKAMTVLASGGGDAVVKPICMLLVNKNAKGEEFRIYVPSASVDGGLSFPFSSDKANETMKIPFAFKAKMATDHERGEQLVRIENEQGQNIEIPQASANNTVSEKSVENTKDDTNDVDKE